MNWVSIILLVLRFVVDQLPRMIENYKKASADNKYKSEADRIDAALKLLRESHGRDKLDHLRELEK